VKLLLYIRTVRHLRPAQLVGRVWMHLPRRRPVIRPAPAVRRRGGRWLPWSWRDPSLLGLERARFLGVERAISSPSDWDDPTAPKLWRYNLHYHDDLVARGAPERFARHATFLARWLAENPPGEGTAWEPYPVSIRIVNWVKWFLRVADAERAPIAPQLRDSLSTQSRYLRTRIEFHLLGNHVWANAKALIFAGAYFHGAEAHQWLREGLRLFEHESQEQILADGGHFERSPAYHAILLEDVLDLINLTGAIPEPFEASFRARLTLVAHAMLHWLRVMTHPDGQVAFFNDAAFGMAARYKELAEYARQLGVALDSASLAPVEELPSSGYVRLASGRAVLLCDVAELGPAYQPGHAHADTLSFELSLSGQRVLVNSGTSLYEAGPERLRQRSTAAHNTVLVDDTDSSEVWAAFRVARRAHPLDLGVTQGAQLVIRCAHDGYRHLPGRPIHRRLWQLDTTGLTIIDRVEGGFRRAQARYHLHPLVSVEAPAEGTLGLVLPGGHRVCLRVEGGTLGVEETTWHSEFGATESNRCVRVEFCGTEVKTTLHWGAS
jgi:uncharacterized heparinase superfamily protein